MKRGRWQRAGAAVTAATTMAAWMSAAPGAWAQEPASAEVEPPDVAPAPVAEGTTPYVGPDRALIAAGALIFTAMYVPVVAIGAGSALSVDRRLYIPVAGPWIDLAQRHVCVAGNLDCNMEIANKVLLATDGIFQDIGVLTALAGFIVTEEAPVVTTAKANGPKVRVAPELGSGQMGIAAVGTF